ncbi:SCO1664 family protein [Kineosporia sp. A_224]|uniref:SCO1664 family protein n=1 Tax=Kineosporia sp. A_224 TaxID=1962180 RepID=UPI0018EA1FA1|nr:SCO1664 family protein [Kineosporia sp. A_224]
MPAEPADQAPAEPSAAVDEATRVEILSRGELEIRGRLVDASNATLLASVTLDGVTAACVYKPVAGERPLWDFPSRTLARREVAAYVLSAGAGLDVVPVTVLREGPYGTGSVQWWVDEGQVDEDGDPVSGEPGAGLVDVVPPQELPAGWRRILDAEGIDGRPVVLAHADDPTLRRMALFDAVANNADRKGGHVVRDAEGGVFGVDHGLTFNLDDKLRTVLWGWAGERLPGQDRELLAVLVRDLEGGGPVRGALDDLLATEEVDRTAERARDVLSAGRYPRPSYGRPPIPWPAF